MTAFIFSCQYRQCQIAAVSLVICLCTLSAAHATSIQIKSIAPTSGTIQGGTSITIIGRGFVSGATVKLGGVTATAVTVINSTSITAVVPMHAAGIVDVAVTNTNNTTTILAQGYTYLAPSPNISTINPTSSGVGGGTPITITGSGFATNAMVTMGGSAASAVTVVNDTTITATIPVHAAGPVDVMIRNIDGQSFTFVQGFAYISACSTDESAPTISIITPRSGDAVTGDRVLVMGIYSGPENTGITVNGVVAITDGTMFYANNIPLSAGAASITASAMSPLGKAAKSIIDVTSTGAKIIEVAVANDIGTVPFLTQLHYVYRGAGKVQRIGVDFNGDGVEDFSTTNLATPISYQYTVPGLYLARLTLNNNQGQSYVADIALNATPGDTDARFNAIFSRFRGALLCGDVDAALLNMMPSARNRYRNALTLLRPYFATIFGSFSTLQRSEIGAEYAEYAVNRTIDGVDRIFFMYFQRDEDGIWRIDSL